jgi:hypothetical protein
MNPTTDPVVNARGLQGNLNLRSIRVPGRDAETVTGAPSSVVYESDDRTGPVVNARGLQGNPSSIRVPGRVTAGTLPRERLYPTRKVARAPVSPCCHRDRPTRTVNSESGSAARAIRSLRHSTLMMNGFGLDCAGHAAPRPRLRDGPGETV